MQRGRQAGRLLRDLDEAVRAADPPGRPARDDGVGLRRGKRRRATAGCSSTTPLRSRSRRRWNRPVRVKWINELVDANGNYLPHLLPVDPTLHWANPPGGTDGPRHAADVHGDARPVHGPGADRHARARRRRRGRRQRRLRGGVVSACGEQHPGGLRHGRAPGTTSSRARRPGRTASRWGPGFATFQYPNENRASTIWYHDHALGMTRLNVYAGPAGFYLVRGGPAGDDAVLDTPNRPQGRRFPAPRRGRTTSSRPTSPTARSRSRSRIARSTTTARSSTPTRASSSTGSSDGLHPGGRRSRRSGTPSSSGT